MAEFYCLESGHLDRNLISAADTNLFNDSRVLDNMLIREKIRMDYFEKVQSEINPAMRKIVSSWMLEVCEDQWCENAIFPMAMNYFDRFLSTTNVPKKHLQLLGCVCLLVASKFRQSKAITIDNIIDYTDFSVTREEVLNWELLVLSKLKWEISATIPDDFTEYLLNRLHIEGRDAEKVRKHAAIFISLSTTEHHFMEFTPSVLASACIAVSALGLSSQIEQKWSNRHDLLQKLQLTTQRPMESIERCYELVEQLVHKNATPVEEPYQISYCSERSAGMSPSNKNAQMELGNDLSPQQPETPTDVQDVNF